MPEKRLSISFDGKSYQTLLNRAKGRSIAGLVRHYVERGIELDEDLELTELLAESLKEAEPDPIPAETVWKRLGLE